MTQEVWKIREDLDELRQNAIRRMTEGNVRHDEILDFIISLSIQMSRLARVVYQDLKNRES